MKILSRGLSLSVLASTAILAGSASAQTATLHDGTVLTQRSPLEDFGTEGPIYGIDAVNRSLDCMGVTMTLPAFINSAVPGIHGTNDGSGNPITANTFDRLLDSNAMPGGRDAVNGFSGAGRSLFSSALAGQADPTAATAITNHAVTLKSEASTSLGQTVVSDPSMNSYSGGTLKCAGSVYEDSTGKAYFIPDAEAVIELAENVAIGKVMASAPATGTSPASFMIGNMVCMMNQDPRFTHEILGFGGIPLSETALFAALADPVNAGAVVALVGHMVGDKFMMVQWLETDFIDGTAPVHIGVERFRFRDKSNEIRIRGGVDQPDGLSLHIQFMDVAGDLLHEMQEPLIPDLVTGAAVFSARTRDDMNVADVYTISLYCLDGSGNEVARSTYLRSDVE